VALAIDPRFVIELEPARRARVSAATYRRRRLAALVLVVGLLGAALAGARSVLADRGDGPATVPAVVPAAAAPGVYVVQPGDNLWTIAGRLVPPGQVASLVEDLVEVNGGATVRVGQVLVLPE
jgi:LysM repeat protein